PSMQGKLEFGMPLSLRGARQLALEIHRRRTYGRDVIADHKAKRMRKQDRQQAIIEKWHDFAERGVTPTCWLYRHYDADGDLLYVGMSLSIWSRQLQHLRKAPRGVAETVAQGRHVPRLLVA